MSLDDRRHAPLDACLRLARRLEGCATRPTLEALAAEFGVSRRTVLRYLIVLERNGYHVPPLDDRRQASPAARVWGRRAAAPAEEGG